MSLWPAKHTGLQSHLSSQPVMMTGVWNSLWHKPSIYFVYEAKGTHLINIFTCVATSMWHRYGYHHHVTVMATYIVGMWHMYMFLCIELHACIGLNVYIYICSPFYATSICILNVVIIRTCTRASYLWADFLSFVHLTFMDMAWNKDFIIIII